MTKEQQVTSRPRRAPSHPGEVLRADVLPRLNLSVSAAARHLRVTRQTLHRHGRLGRPDRSGQVFLAFRTCWRIQAARADSSIVRAARERMMAVASASAAVSVRALRSRNM